MFPLSIQVLALASVVVLAAIGLGHGTDLGPEQLKLFRKTNITTLVVWGLWWPGMIAIALLFGRAWCTVCPMELVNRMGDIVARKVGLPRSRMGALLRAGWITLAIYLVMQLLVSGFSIHRVPHATALLLVVLFGLALLTGFVFKRPRSFCLGFCPAAALLSVYGRYTPLQLSKRDESVCRNCETKDCVSKSNRHRFDKRSCPSFLHPYDHKQSDGCVLCLQCVKVCPYENMGFGMVSEQAPIRKKSLLHPFEAAFVMIAFGFVAHEVIGEVKWLDSYFHAVPETLGDISSGISFGWFEALWFLVLFPLTVWMLVSGLGYLLGHRSGIKSLLLAAATGAAPVVAVAHLAKAAAKISSWGGFLPLAISDPTGVQNFVRLSEGSLAKPEHFWGFSFIGWLMLVATVAIAWRAWRWARQIPTESQAAARSGLVTSAILFSSLLLIWALPNI
jgi:polyferredoxin